MSEEIAFVKGHLATLKSWRGWFMTGRKILIRDYELRLAILERADKIMGVIEKQKDPVLRRRAK